MQGRSTSIHPVCPSSCECPAARDSRTELRVSFAIFSCLLSFLASACNRRARIGVSDRRRPPFLDTVRGSVWPPGLMLVATVIAGHLSGWFANSRSADGQGLPMTAVLWIEDILHVPTECGGGRACARAGVVDPWSGGQCSASSGESGPQELARARYLAFARSPASAPLLDFQGQNLLALDADGAENQRLAERDGFPGSASSALSGIEGRPAIGEF